MNRPYYISAVIVTVIASASVAVYGIFVAPIGGVQGAFIGGMMGAAYTIGWMARGRVG